MTLRSDEKCSHPSGHHPYHYVQDRPGANGERYEDFICGYCGKLARTLRVK